MFTSILAEEESEDGAGKKLKKTVEVRVIEAEIVKFN